MQRRSFLTGTAGLLAWPCVHAQNRAMRIVVPFAPGGSGDLIPRTIAPTLSEILEQAVIVENISGGGGRIGASHVARSTPDGLTFGVATVSTHGILPAVMKRPSYDPLRDFLPVSNLARVPNVISVHPSLPARNLAELIALVRSPTSRIPYGSPGVGSLGHMMGELFKQATQGSMTHIPYRGAGPALADAIAGHVMVLCDNLPASLPQIRTGKLRAMAVAWPQRLSQLPDIPTFAESGLAVLNGPAWFGLVAPAGTRPQAVERLQQAVARAMQQAAVRTRIEELGAMPIANTSQDFGAEMAAELHKWKELARAADIALDD